MGGIREKEELDLKHCPFCGGLASLSLDIRFGYRINCLKCGASTKRFDYLRDAEKAWNSRKGRKNDI